MSAIPSAIACAELRVRCSSARSRAASSSRFACSAATSLCNRSCSACAARSRASRAVSSRASTQEVSGSRELPEFSSMPSRPAAPDAMICCFAVAPGIDPSEKSGAGLALGDEEDAPAAPAPPGAV